MSAAGCSCTTPQEALDSSLRQATSSADSAFCEPGLCRSRARTGLRWLQIRVEVEEVVNGMPEILFAAEIAFRSQNRRVSQQELNLLKFSTIGVAQLRTSAQVRRRSCGAICSSPARWQQLRTTYQTTFSEIPEPQTFPTLATARKIFPFVIAAAEIHSSSACLTQRGIGTVRT